MSDILLGQVNEIDVDLISPAEDNPRQVFDGIESLAGTFTENGSIQPITVRQVGDGFEIIDGARRYEAAVHRGDPTMRCIVQKATDAEATLMRLLANLQREDLTPIDEALAIKQHKESNGLTLDELVPVLGKSKTRLSSAISLASLPEQVHRYFRNKDAKGFILTQKHGEILLALLPAHEDALIELAAHAYEERLSCEKLSRLVKLIGREAKPEKVQPDVVVGVENCLSKRFEEFGGVAKVKAKGKEALVVTAKAEIKIEDLAGSLFALFGITYDASAGTETAEAEAEAEAEVQDAPLQGADAKAETPAEWESPNVLVQIHETGKEAYTVTETVRGFGMSKIRTDTHTHALYTQGVRGKAILRGFCKENVTTHVISAHCTGLKVTIYHDYGTANQAIYYEHKGE